MRYPRPLKSDIIRPPLRGTNPDRRRRGLQRSHFDACHLCKSHRMSEAVHPPSSKMAGLERTGMPGMSPRGPRDQ